MAEAVPNVLSTNELSTEECMCLQKKFSSDWKLARGLCEAGAILYPIIPRHLI